MVGPPSLEETVGGLAQQLPEILTQGFAQVGVDLGGADARMSQQNLDEANVHTSLQHVRGEAVPQRVRHEAFVETALASSLVESGPCGGIGKVSDDPPTGKQPLFTAVGLPDLSKHVQHRFGQRESSLLVALSDHAEEQLLGVDGRDGQRDRLSNSQPIGVDEREAAAINGLLQRGD